MPFLFERAFLKRPLVYSHTHLMRFFSGEKAKNECAALNLLETQIRISRSYCCSCASALCVLYVPLSSCMYLYVKEGVEHKKSETLQRVSVKKE